jgi:acyl carrier protein
MELPEVRTKLRGIFRDVFDDESLEITDEMTAQDVEDWDSLNHINLIVAVEKGFGIKFTTREVNSLKNVGELTRLVVQKIA